MACSETYLATKENQKRKRNPKKKKTLTCSVTNIGYQRKPKKPKTARPYVISAIGNAEP
jgi:hypothetical protein